MRLILISLIFLTACSNLTASILGGPQEFSYTPTYMVEGQGHTMTVTFTVTDGVVTGLQIEPGAVSGSERGHQFAFSANIRRYVLEQPVDAISLPASVGEEAQLTDVFRAVVVQLQNDQ